MATYIIQAGADGPVKIGRTDDIDARLASLQTSHHSTLRLLRVVDTAFDAERCFHERFAAYRIRGEWFTFHECMLTFVPPEPAREPSIEDVVRAARTRAREEVSSLTREIWLALSLGGWMPKRQFSRRLAEVLGCKVSRAANLIGDRSRVIEVHELEGLRALARKLRTEDATRARVNMPLPLFPDVDREGR